MRRSLAAVVLFAALGAIAPAADPPPLVRPVVPAGGAVRVRVPLGGPKTDLMQFKAKIGNLKGKKGDSTPVTVYFDPQPNAPTVTLQQWKAWGFAVPADRTGVIPELVITGAQLAPKPAKGRDVEYRITGLKVTLYEAPGGDKAGITDTLGLSLRDLTGGADRAFEPRVYFADRFLELTAPAGAVKRLGTGDAPAPEPQVTAEEKLVPAAMPFVGGGGYPLVGFVSVNGQTQFFDAKKQLLPVMAGLSSSSLSKPGVMMSVGMARGCGVELNKEAGPTAGKVKELRFGMQTGPGFKAQKDLVLKDVTVTINPEESGAFIWLGPAFVTEHFADGVYGCGADGTWRLHGRAKPDLLEDQKTRKPVAPKKP